MVLLLEGIRYHTDQWTPKAIKTSFPGAFVSFSKGFDVFEIYNGRITQHDTNCYQPSNYLITLNTKFVQLTLWWQGDAIGTGVGVLVVLVVFCATIPLPLPHQGKPCTYT